MHYAPVSVVIPTLGEGDIKKTIELINRGSVIPNEILVCIPRIVSQRVGRLKYENVVIVSTECIGQVAQRTVGFKSASNSVVLQLDDDVFLSNDCLELLLRSLKRLGASAAVGPSILSRDSGRSVYKRNRYWKALDVIYFKILNGPKGFEPGTITKAGVNVGWDLDDMKNECQEVEWLAGGCVMHYTRNLVFDEYFPYSGKAYCEDIIHSIILRSRGIKLYVLKEAKCRIELSSLKQLKFKNYLRELYAESRVRSYVVRMGGFNIGRMYLFYFFRVLAYLPILFKRRD